MIAYVLIERHTLPDFAIVVQYESGDKRILSLKVNQNGSGREISSHLPDLTTSFSRSGAYAAALVYADNYELPSLR